MPDVNAQPGGGADVAAEPPAIPGLNLLRRIGRGSYGDVWLARDPAGEFRAVKIVYRKTFERDRPFEREFSGIQKFQPVSHAEPSQVSILQVGRNDEAGFFFYVMELADDESNGRPIDPASYKPKTLRSEVARCSRIPYDQALDISLSLTKALEHLHRHGLIHRDIKPSNIIFVNGVAKLADIGLVTDVGASISYVGTEGFLPPEGPVSQQADIYSLGKVLYEMSTGQDRMDFPELPTFLGDSAEKQGLLELNLVFLKACQNDPLKRYRTAAEMSADLSILRSGKSLKRTRALERRLANVTRAFAVTAAVGLLLAGGFYGWNQHRLKRLQKEVAQRDHAQRIAERATHETTRQLVNALTANAEQAANEGDFGRALAWRARALTDETDPARDAEHQLQITKWLEQFPRLSAFLAHTGGIHSARLNDDHTRVITAGVDQTVQIWDAASGLPVSKPLRHKSPVLDAALSSDEMRLLSVCQDGSAWLWRLDETIAYEVAHGAPVRAAEFGPNGRFAITRAADNRVIVLDGLSARPRFTFQHDAIPSDARFSPDGRLIAVAATNKVYVWDAEGDKVSQAISAHGEVTAISFDPASRRLVAVAGDTAQVLNAVNGEWSAFPIKEAAPIARAHFTPDGRHVITATKDGTVRRWDSVTGERVDSSWSCGGTANSLGVSPDGAAVFLIAGGSLCLTDLNGPAASSPARAAILTAEFSSDSRLILAARGDGAVWIAETVPVDRDRPFPPDSFSRAELTAAARLIAGREIDGQQRLVAVAPGRLLADWRLLRTNALFTPRDAIAWHRVRLDQLAAQRHWFGVRFHAERLVNLNAADAQVRQLHDQAASELARLAATPGRSPNAMPERSPDTPPNLIDLTAFYNASLTDTWLPAKFVSHSNDLAQLPRGLQKFNNIPFDVRGLIQLSSSALENLGGKFPQQVPGIPVNRKARKLHFLHGAAWDALYGTVIGKYVIHYANGETTELKIVFGKHVRDWWFPPTQPQLTMEAAVAWQGANTASRNMGMALRIYHFPWDNSNRDLEIRRIDFVSAMARPAPFLIAITAED